MQKKAKKKEQKNKKFMTYIKNKKAQLVAINHINNNTKCGWIKQPKQKLQVI